MGKVYGLIGYPVKHSLSGVMHNAAFKYLGMDAEYRIFEIIPEELEDFLLDPQKLVKDLKGNTIPAKEIVGFNITIPHKVQAKDILDRSELFKGEDSYYVELSGAINTVKRVPPGGVYYNTDAYGFETTLKNDLQFTSKGEKNALVIGCGGAGRVIVAVLVKGGIGIKKIHIYDKNKEAVEYAKNHFLKYFHKYPYIKEKIMFVSQEDIPNLITDCQLLVNASPVGMNSNTSPIDTELLHSRLYVYDVVYNRKTALIREAEKKCRSAIGGLNMLLYQGGAAFKIWTEKEPPLNIMQEALKKELKDES